MKKEIEIENLFKSAGLEEPSEVFTSKVMDQVYLEKLPVSVNKTKPIFSGNMKIATVISLVIITVLALAFPESNGEVGKISIFFTKIKNVIDFNYQVFSIVPIIFTSAFILLLIDNLFNNRKHRKSL